MSDQERPTPEAVAHVLLDALVATDMAVAAVATGQTDPEQAGDGVALALGFLNDLATATATGVPPGTVLPPPGLRVDITPLAAGTLMILRWLVRELATRTAVDHDDVIIELREMLTEAADG